MLVWPMWSQAIYFLPEWQSICEDLQQDSGTLDMLYKGWLRVQTKDPQTN